jgi:uracil-DNA glycosylase
MGGQHSTLLADSYYDWWTLAGVEVLVGENPAGWLAHPAPEKPAAKPQEQTEGPSIVEIMAAARSESPATAPSKPVPPTQLPSNWDEFRQWLAEGDNVPGSQWDARRVLPVGPGKAPIMLLTAWPELTDQRDGRLFTGDTGKLLDAMLRAIGMDRKDCYTAARRSLFDRGYGGASTPAMASY